MGIYTDYIYTYIYITGLLKPQDNIIAFYLTIIIKLASTEILQCVDFCFRCDNLKKKKKDGSEFHLNERKNFQNHVLK